MKTQKAIQYGLTATKSEFNRVQITSSKDSADYCRQFFHEDILIYESFFLLLLNQRNETIGYVKISQGGVAGTVADPLLIAKYAIDSLSRNVILCHNHPSGNLKPSEQDKELTKKVAQGLKLFSINVLDHIILTDTAYFSFLDECILF